MITNLPQYSGEKNAPGYITFKFIPVGEVVSIPDHLGDYNINSDITLQSGKFWRAGYASIGTLQLRENSIEKSGTTQFRQVLDGFIPRDVPDLTRLLEEMKHGRFLVLAKNAEGDERLIGSIENGCRFSYKFDSRRIGEKKVKGYSFQFYRTSITPSPFYYATANVSYGSGGSNDLTWVVSFAAGVNAVEHSVPANGAGTLSSETLDNVDAGTAVYKVNSVVKTLPLTLAAGDTFRVEITQTNAANPSSVTLTGSY